MGTKIAEISDGITILVNYSSLAVCGYGYIVKSLIPLLSESLTVFINKLDKPLDDITLVGHSLGRLKFALELECKR